MNSDEVLNTVKGYPCIEEFLNNQEYPDPDILDRMEGFFLLDSINKYRKNYTYYSFYGMGVPRVSEILKECIGKDQLIDWASKLGKKKYDYYREFALEVGTCTHEAIEEYLYTDRYPVEYLEYTIKPQYRGQVKTAFENFLDWIRYLDKNGFVWKVLDIERKIITPYYGGTIDCIMKINGRTYIIDFKTSKALNYEYLLQTTAYMWAINNGYDDYYSHIDGIGLLRVDKKINKFEDLFLNNFIPEQNVIINQLIMGWSSILNWYYNQINLKDLYKEYFKTYKSDNLFFKSFNKDGGLNETN